MSGIEYGTCQNHGFYLLVIPQRLENKDNARENGCHADALSFIDHGDLHENIGNCAPQDYVLWQRSDLGQGWHQSLLGSFSSTPPHGATPAP